MTMKMLQAAVAATGVMCVIGAAQAAAVDPKPKEMAKAVEAFLVDHGDLCLAMYIWPRDVTAEDRQSNSNEAVQMPVLEHLGIVRSEDVPAPTAADAGAPVEP